MLHVLFFCLYILIDFWIAGQEVINSQRDQVKNILSLSPFLFFSISTTCTCICYPVVRNYYGTINVCQFVFFKAHAISDLASIFVCKICETNEIHEIFWAMKIPCYI